MARNQQTIGFTAAGWLSALLVVSGLTVTSCGESTHHVRPEIRHEHHQRESAASDAADVEAQTREFIGYFFSIKLSDDQQAVRDRALEPLKAVCCDDFPMSDCCCVCNLSRSIWGLSNYLIANLGYDEDRVRTGVEGWLEYVGPSGFSGEACYVDRCSAPFGEDGCGGMDPDHLVTG
jgi:hypothetical protein